MLYADWWCTSFRSYGNSPAGNLPTVFYPRDHFPRNQEQAPRVRREPLEDVNRIFIQYSKSHIRSWVRILFITPTARDLTQAVLKVQVLVRISPVHSLKTILPPSQVLIRLISSPLRFEGKNVQLHAWPAESCSIILTLPQLIRIASLSIPATSKPSIRLYLMATSNETLADQITDAITAANPADKKILHRAVDQALKDAARSTLREWAAAGNITTKFDEIRAYTSPNAPTGAAERGRMLIDTLQLLEKFALHRIISAYQAWRARDNRTTLWRIYPTLFTVLPLPHKEPPPPGLYGALRASQAVARIVAALGSLDARLIDLVKSAGQRDINPHVIDRCLKRFPQQCNLCLAGQDSKLAKSIYEETNQLPQTATEQDFRVEGYRINRSIGVSDSLVICFDRDAVPHVLKTLNNAEKDRITAIPVLQSEYIIKYSLRESNRGNPLMIMPLLPTTLEHLPDLSRLLSGKLWQHMKNALSCLHGHQLAHMDVKPSNICIDQAGNFILIDLGSVVRFGQKSASTLAYIPQDLSNYQVASAAVDWWMLAATLGERGCGMSSWRAGAANPTKEKLLCFGQKSASTLAYIPQDLSNYQVASAAVDWWMLAATLGERGCGMSSWGAGAANPTKEEL
ncbi:Serine/threonine protein kinase, partial [Planoprotostelium fungivorum]